MSNITYTDKIEGGTFTHGDANEIKTAVNSKQDALVSGTSIKTINSTSLLGSGDIVTPNTTYSAGTGITVTEGVIACTVVDTNTTYAATDFDIKDLTDSTSLRTAWSWKLATNGSAASLTDFPTLNQNTTGTSGGVLVHKTLTATAANDYAAGDIGYLASAGTVTLTDADAEASSKGLLFMATASISGGASGVFLREGEITLTSHGFTVGAPLFLSTTAGDMTNTAPATAGDFVRLVGYALDANTILFQPSAVWVEVQ